MLSGHQVAVDEAILCTKQRTSVRARKLNVSAPFHCSLLKPAASEFAQSLAALADVAARNGGRSVMG